MDKQEQQAATSNAPPEQTLLQWSSHPMRRRPIAAVLVTVFIFVVSMVIYWAMESRWFSVLALVVLFASLAKFYLPTRFTLTDRKVVIKSTTQTIAKPWTMFRSFYADRNGLLLSPFAEKSRLENFRGIYLIFSGNSDEVIRIVGEKIAEQKSEIATSEEAEK
jgi:lysylphosphatidylglycerol synthetase-like protein (DUF2156 family)